MPLWIWLATGWYGYGALSMMIGLADQLIDRNPAKAHKQPDEAPESSRTALVDLRHLIRGIHPPVLAETRTRRRGP